MAYRLDLPDGSFVTVEDDAKPRSVALAEAKSKFPDAFPAPPGIGQQILGLPAEIGKGFVRGLTVDPISGAASTVYTGARAAGADLTPFEKTAFGKGLASAQTALAPSDEGLVTQFGSGLGSLLSYIPGGILKGGIGLAAKLGQAGGVGAEEARSRAEQARLEGQADATAGQEFAAQLGGTAVGFSELAPVRLLTKPIEQILRGVPKSQADLIAPGLFNSAKRMVATGGVEGLQEGMANIAQDLIAKGIYNPNLEVGESALGDAAMGASIGAFAQGAIELATRGKRGQLYEQLKTQERLKEEAEQQRIAQQQQAVIAAQEQEKMGQAMGALGATPQIDPATGKPVLLLGAPAKEVNLQDPLGIRFDANDLSPKVVNDINKARKERGLPAIDQFTVEDLYDLAPNKNAISELLGRKMGYNESVSVTPRNIFDIAASKNIDVQDPGFAEFLTRTTGTPDIRRMTAQQLFAAQQSISALPDFTELTKLPTGSIATVFDEKTYNKTINDLKKTVLNTGPLGKEATVQEIMDFSGLTKPQDAERLLQTAIQRGDLSASPTRGTVGTSINISVPFVPKSVVPGPDIRRGDFMESENVGYDIVSEDGTFKQFRPTLGAAEDLVAKANQNRETKVARIAGEIDRVSSGIELDKQRLGQLQEVGEEGSAEYKRLQAKIQKQEVNLGNLNSKIQSVSQPLQIKAKDKPRSRTGYTLFDNGKPIGTYPTKEDADIAAIQSLSDEQLDGVINAAPRSDVEGALEEPFGKQQLPTGTIRGATPRRLYIEATKEKERRFRQQAGLPPLAAPVEIKITGDAQAAAEKLRAVGLTVRFMPEVEKEVPEINKRLRAVLDKLGLQEVRLNIIESLSVKGFIIDGPDGKPMGFYPQPQAGTPKFKEVMAVLNDAKAKGLNVREGVSSANGSYVAQLIEIALDSSNPIRATRHEALHALRDLGFFTNEQWSVLERKAKSEWMKKYNIAQRYGGLDYESQIEEAVADAFSDFDQTQPPAGLVGVLFRKIKTFFEALGNALRGSGFQTAADVFTRVEEGGLTGPGATTAGETKLSLQEPVSPLAQYVAPEDAEGRLRRRLGRAEGVGAPSNDRLVFGKGKEKLIIGKITPQDWKERVQNTMSAPEIEDARNWYQQLNDFFTPVFGERASEFSLAWLLSQQRASPTKGFTDVLRASDIAENKLRIKKAGLNEKSLVAALKGEVPEGGIGAKLMDFVDSELGKSLRTVMGDKKEGRQPAAIDVWAQRDIGFIDDTVKDFVAKKFGKDAADTLDVDTARFGEPQYEYGVDFYNDVAQYLNRQKYMGGGWTAREVQAVGWVNMQIFMGVKPEFVRDIVNGNTRRVSIGLAPGTGSVMTGRLMGKEIPIKDAQNIINDLAKISNIKVTQSLDGIGSYLTYVEGSIQVDAVGSPESVDSFMDMIGYVFQQTEVINTRPLASGKNSAIDILSPSLNSQSKAVEFFTEYLKAMPKDKNGDPIAPGFQQVKVDGVPGIRLVNFGGKWNKKQLEALAKASEVAEAATGIKEAQFVDMNVQFTSTANDWVKYPDGDQYVDSLRNRGRLQEAQLLRDQFPPTRFDLAGDGTINWRPRLEYEPKFSLRSDELIGRPGIGGGVSIREQQPSAQSYDAVHYGKQRVNNLAGSMYGTGIKGAEAQRLSESTDPRIRERAYFYIPYSNGRMPMPEAGLGNEVHIQRLNNLLGPSPEAQALSRAARTPDGQFDANAFESSVIDAGYDGYAIPDMGMAVVLGADVPVQPRGTRQEIEERPEEGKIQIGDRKYSLRSPETPEFKKWFGDSKIVDENNKPIVVYHGSPISDITVFDPTLTGKTTDAGYFGTGIYFSEYPETAESYAGKEGTVYPVFLSIKNPFYWNSFLERAKSTVDVYGTKGFFSGLLSGFKKTDSSYGKNLFAVAQLGDKLPKVIHDAVLKRAKITPEEINYWSIVGATRRGEKTEDQKIEVSKIIKRLGNALRDELKSRGYDGIIVDNPKSDNKRNREYVAFEPNQVKSAFNQKPTESPDIRYSLRQTDTNEFKQWFGKSQIKTLRGEPKRMYHGTARDISEFIPKQANAIFLTDNPRFAESFSDMSEDYMINEYMNQASPEETSKIIEKAITKGLKDKDILPTAATTLRGMSLKEASQTVGVGDYIRSLIKEQLPTRQNVMPLYVRAENPFDYENRDAVKQLMNEIKDFEDINSLLEFVDLDSLSELEGFLRGGDWGIIEEPEIQRIIKKMGFDSFYVMEGDQKNLAVYDPNQIKSAIGNVGTFARDNNDIRYSIALGAIEPSTSLIPDVGGNPNGILGFMPDRLGGKPIRMLVGTHNDLVPELDNERMRRPQSYGANHILNRVLSDPSRIPGGAEELLEKIVKTAQTTAQKYNRIFKEGNMFIIYDGRNSLIVSPEDDAMSIVTMYVQNQPERRYGNAVFSGRAPSMPQEFVEPIRGMDVVAGEGRVQIKPSEVKVIKPSKVLEISPVTEMAPTKAGTLGVKKLSLVEPIDTDTAQRIPQDTFNVDPNTSKDNLIYLLQNKQIDLKRVIDGIRSAGKDIADKWNAYLKEELFHGRSATRIRFFMDRELQPLLKKMESSDISLDQMDEYLLARHAPEANSYIRSINPDPNANAGMSDQEAANYINSLPAPRRAALERIAKDVDAITKGTRQLMVDYGLEDQKTIDTWERTYKKYVPLFREETEGNPISTGRGYQIRGSTTKRRMGSTRSVVDVLANIAMQREKTIVRGEKNRVGNSLYGLVLTNPNKGFWGVIDPGKVNRQTLRNELIGLGIDSAEADQMINEMSSRPYQKTIDKATGLVVQRIPPSWAKAENIFVTRINGQDRFIGFNKNDERAMRMATTLKNLDAQQQAEAIKMMGTAGDYYKGTINAVGKATRFFASVNTQYNPAFGIYNLMRDIGGAVLNLQSTPLKGSERKIISDALGLIKDIYSDLRRQRQGLPADSKSAQIFEEFELEGGKTGYRDLFEDSQSRAEQLQKDLEDFKSGKPLKGKGKAVMRWLSDFNDSIENAIRVSVYKNALDKGISKERAASLAKNITVNFNRTGAMSRNFQTLYAFFNASVQGTTRIAETLFTPDGKLSPTGKKIVMGGITLGLMQAVLLAMAGLDDDEVPDFVKDKSFIIPYGDGKYLAVPMPLGYNIIPGFGRRVMEFAMSDDKNVGKSVFETTSMIIDGFNPLGSATFVQTLAPTIADPIVALAENKDFTGKPIAREDVNSLVPTPGYTRKSQNASAITEALAYGINLLSGGTEFKRGVISPTPDQIEYLVGQVFGGVGREAMKVGRGLEALATGEELATYNIPIAGRLVGNIQQKAAQTGRFYDNIKALNEHQAEIEGRMARGEDITEYVNENPEAMLYQLGDKTYSKISKLRQLKKTLEESGASRDQTKAIDDAMLNLMVSLNMSYNSARQQ